MRATAVLGLVVIGCVTDDLSGSRCDDGGACGEGYVCREGVCRRGDDGGAEGGGAESAGGGSGTAGGMAGGAAGGTAGGAAGGSGGGSAGGTGGGLPTGLQVGAACAQHVQCLSGNCAAGQCACGLALNCGRCQRACDAAGTGCVAVDAGEVDPSGQCATRLATCSTSRCAADGTCLRYDAGTVCAPRHCENTACVGQCTAGAVRAEAQCGATGGCPDAGLAACANALVCDAQTLACRTDCRFSADCVSSTWCSGGSCEAAADAGACTERVMCASRVCGVGGLCIGCDTDDDCSLELPHCQNNACVACTVTQDYTCHALGDTCEAPGICRANTIGSCPDPRATQVLDNVCSCEQPGVICANGRVCANGACRTLRSEVCFTSTECSSGVCDAGRCE